MNQSKNILELKLKFIDKLKHNIKDEIPLASMWHRLYQWLANISKLSFLVSRGHYVTIVGLTIMSTVSSLLHSKSVINWSCYTVPLQTPLNILNHNPVYFLLFIVLSFGIFRQNKVNITPQRKIVATTLRIKSY